MPSPTLEFWYSALSAEFGISISVSDVNQGRQALYRARAASGDPDLDSISIHVSPYQPHSELWLVKKREGKPNGPTGE